MSEEMPREEMSNGQCANGDLAMQKIKLRRVLGLHHGVAIICGLVIGSGVYVVPQGIMSRVQAPGLMLIVWVGAALYSLSGALSFAELGTTFPVFGEKYAYLLAMFGPYVGFQSLWAYAFIHRPGANAIKCLTFARYVIQPLFPDCDFPHGATLLIAVIMASLLTFINCLNIKWAARFQGLLSTICVSTLVTLSIAGFVWVGKGNVDYIRDMFQGASSDVGNITLATSTAIYAMGGWRALNFMVEELKDPYKTLPRAICLSIILITVLYIFVNFAYIVVLGPEKIIQSSAVAVSMAQVVFGPAAWIFSILIAISAAGSFNSGILVTSRVIFAAARNKHLPKIFSNLNIHTSSPVVAFIFQGFLTLFLCLVDVFTILNNIAFMTIFFEGLCITGMVYYRWKEPRMQRPLKIPIIIAVLFMTMTWSLIVIMAITKPLESAVGFVISMVSGTLLYFYMVVWKPKFSLAVKLTRFIQKLLLSAPEDENAAEEIVGQKNHLSKH